jgi:hypothetical protein
MLKELRSVAIFCNFLPCRFPEIKKKNPHGSAAIENSRDLGSSTGKIRADHSR